MNNHIRMGSRLSVTLFGTLILCATLACGPAVAADHGESERENSEKSSGEGQTAPEMMEQDPLGVPPMPRTAPGMAGLFGSNYWYLPYAVTNEEQGLAFVKAYGDLIEAGKKPGKTLEVPEGKGAGGSDTLYRLESGVTDMFIRDINNPAATAVSQSEIPVIIAQPGPGASGANVLFMDGHVEFVRYGEFPVTRKFIDALRKLDPPEYAE